MPRLTLTLLIALFSLEPLAADSDAQYAAVRALGALNGVALQCKYVDEIRRMKAAVVDNAPKERSFGIAFDESTNDAFLAFIREGGICPGPAGFSEQVDAGVEELRRAFAKP